MKRTSAKPVHCAIYTRVSTDHGLEQDFNSLDAQYDASQAYIRSQVHAGWSLLRAKYEDGGFSGGNTDRPALRRLLDDVRAGKVDVIVVYKVDRLTRSLADFAKLVELFDQHGVSFVSVTQQFNTTTSMGRLTLNVLLSFAQFEREVTSERAVRFDARTLSAAVAQQQGARRPFGQCLDGLVNRRHGFADPPRASVAVQCLQEYEPAFPSL
jgi:site-specific DNA recombinase